MSPSWNITVKGIQLNYVDPSNIAYVAYDDTWQKQPPSSLDPNSNSDDARAGKVGSKLQLDRLGASLFPAATLPDPFPPNANQTRPNVTIALDDHEPTRVTISSPPGDPFYTSGLLSPAPHKLSVTVDEATDDFPFIFDGFLYLPVQNLDAYDPNAADSGTPAGASSSANLDQLQGQIQDLLKQLNDAQNKPRGPPVAVIVGATVGGVILLAIVSYALWYFFIRPRRNGGRAFFYAPAKASDMLQDEFEPEPYHLLSRTSTARSQSPVPSIERVPLRQGTDRSSLS
ncbi:hypothetical protein C8Q77DRAFT_1186441 [Trametes polyzona]|nr:hypothetical protein C8Q77DRAFT_1186441 [Trametes polyzona]